MTDAIGNIEKRSRGRPKTDATPIMVRVQPEQLAQIDGWAQSQSDRPTRPEAIRRLIDKGLQD